MVEESEHFEDNFPFIRSSCATSKPAALQGVSLIHFGCESHGVSMRRAAEGGSGALSGRPNTSGEAFAAGIEGAVPILGQSLKKMNIKSQ